MLIIIVILLAIIASTLLFGAHVTLFGVAVLAPLYLGFMALLVIIALCLWPWLRRNS